MASSMRAWGNAGDAETTGGKLCDLGNQGWYLALFCFDLAGNCVVLVGYGEVCVVPCNLKKMKYSFYIKVLL